MDPRYWTPTERRRLQRVKTLRGLGNVGVTILERMRHPEQEIVQICGPMTTGGLGSLEENMAQFSRAIEQAERQGLRVFNQIPFQGAIIRITDHHDGKEYCVDILEVFYRRIFECGHVSRTLFLPGWQESRGARWERSFVSELGIAAEEYPREWL